MLLNARFMPELRQGWQPFLAQKARPSPLFIRHGVSRRAYLGRGTQSRQALPFFLRMTSEEVVPTLLAKACECSHPFRDFHIKRANREAPHLLPLGKLDLVRRPTRIGRYLGSSLSEQASSSSMGAAVSEAGVLPRTLKAGLLASASFAV